MNPRCALETRLLENSRTRDGSLTRDASLFCAMLRVLALAGAPEGQSPTTLDSNNAGQIRNNAGQGPSTVGSERRPRFADLL